MPRLKTEQIKIDINEVDAIEYADVVFHVNSQGEFYCVIPEKLLPCYAGESVYHDSVRKDLNRAGQPSLYATELEALRESIRGALHALNTVEKVEEHVIGYNIDAYLSFALDGKDRIVPNAGVSEDARWPGETIASRFNSGYRRSHFNRGYRLLIGAKALTKTTITYGEHKEVKYAAYYKGKSHLGFDNPAQRLNAWSGFQLGNSFEEIPYSDEAAEFFYRLMDGMARLVRMVKDATLDPASLERLIADQSGADRLAFFPSLPATDE